MLCKLISKNPIDGKSFCNGYRPKLGVRYKDLLSDLEKKLIFKNSIASLSCQRKEKKIDSQDFIGEFMTLVVKKSLPLLDVKM